LKLEIEIRLKIDQSK